MSELKVPQVAAAPKVVPFEGRIPAYWSIYPLEDEKIEARNAQTGETK